MALTKFKCIPVVIQLSNCTCTLAAQVTTECDQSMVESGVTNCRQTLPVFTFMNKRGNTNTEPYKLNSDNIFKVIQEEIQQPVKENGANNARKVHVVCLLTDTHVSGHNSAYGCLHKTLFFFSTPTQNLYFYIPISGQLQ